VVRPRRISRATRQATIMNSTSAFSSRSRVGSCSTSTRQPCFNTKKNSSISQRARYQSTSSAAASKSRDLFETVAGTWAWEGKDCATDWHQISFRDDNTLAHFENPDGVIAESSGGDFYTYQVRGHDQDSIRLLLNGEYRNDDAGNPVEWDLVLVDPDT